VQLSHQPLCAFINEQEAIAQPNLCLAALWQLDQFMYRQLVQGNIHHYHFALVVGQK
jgi:hypothetical protein